VLFALARQRALREIDRFAALGALVRPIDFIGENLFSAPHDGQLQAKDFAGS
jgi:hypothetical protein